MKLEESVTCTCDYVHYYPPHSFLSEQLSNEIIKVMWHYIFGNRVKGEKSCRCDELMKFGFEKQGSKTNMVMSEIMILCVN